MPDRRKLSPRYAEAVFPDIPWSPTFAEALTLIDVAAGEEIQPELATAFLASLSSSIERADEVVLAHNSLPPTGRRINGPGTAIILGANVAFSPEGMVGQAVFLLRWGVLQNAIEKVRRELSEQAGSDSGSSQAGK